MLSYFVVVVVVVVVVDSDCIISFLLREFIGILAENLGVANPGPRKKNNFGIFNTDDRFNDTTTLTKTTATPPTKKKKPTDKQTSCVESPSPILKLLVFSLLAMDAIALILIERSRHLFRSTTDRLGYRVSSLPEK